MTTQWYDIDLPINEPFEGMEYILGILNFALY